LAGEITETPDKDDTIFYCRSALTALLASGAQLDLVAVHRLRPLRSAQHRGTGTTAAARLVSGGGTGLEPCCASNKTEQQRG